MIGMGYRSRPGGRPYIHLWVVYLGGAEVLTLDALCAEDVASAIALWQWAAVYGGLLREVNPFDQPAVEGSKKATVKMFEGFGPETRSRLERYTWDASQIL